ncbi:MAG TPA: YkgJ family cysteine cluster protein [Nannocystis sp.]
MARYDCLSCGACCQNTPENRAEGFIHYIEVDPAAPLLRRPDLVRKLVVRDEEGNAHLRLHPDGRCVALRGKIGVRVRCDIYRERPTACRRVEAGGELCRAYRRGRGLWV